MAAPPPPTQRSGNELRKLIMAPNLLTTSGHACMYLGNILRIDIKLGTLATSNNVS